MKEIWLLGIGGREMLRISICGFVGAINCDVCLLALDTMHMETQVHNICQE